MELERQNDTGEHDEVEFELYDYVGDIREILNELAEYARGNGRFPIFADSKIDPQAACRFVNHIGHYY